MQEILRTEGIVLDKVESGDYDNFYRVLTKEYGSISLFAKSARKASAKMAGSMEPGSISSIYFIPSRSDYMMLTGTVFIWKPSFLAQSELINELIGQALSYTKKLFGGDFSMDDSQDSFLPYNFLREYLRGISTRDRDETHVILYQAGYYLKILDYAGFKPSLKRCIECNKQITASRDVCYSAREGGALCSTQCASGHGDAIRIGFDSLKLANYLSEYPISTIDKLKIEKRVAADALKMSQNHLQYCLS